MVLPCSSPISASGSCQVWQTCIKVSPSLQIVDSCGPFDFNWSISHLTFSSSSSQTQQPFKVVPRSTPTSATGSCQVWQPCNTVRLALPIVDSFGSFVAYLVHFTSYFSSSSSQKNTIAFHNAKAFNANISNWVVSSVTSLSNSKSFLANCW